LVKKKKFPFVSGRVLKGMKVKKFLIDIFPKLCHTLTVEVKTSIHNLNSLFYERGGDVHD
jgi:hypothetical protein